MTNLPLSSKQQSKRNKQRNFADWRFRAYGVVGLTIAGLALIFLLGSIFSTGYSAFQRTVITLDFNLNAETLELEDDLTKEDILDSNTLSVVKKAIYSHFKQVKKRKDKKKLFKMISIGAELDVRQLLLDDITQLGKTVRLTVPMSSDVDQYYKTLLKNGTPTNRLNDKQKQWFKSLLDKGIVKLEFNTAFFTNGDSRHPELAGILGAMVGSFYTLLICFLIAFPLGVGAAIYLEEFSKDTWLTRLIEANINNLAAVPSIIFGLLGLGIILNVFGMPRSTPLAGGVVLALMTLPTIIITSRSAIKAVPPSIREAGLAMGASPIQVVFHHVMPSAMSGTLTGTIIGMAQALGETAPLLLIGMVAFIASVPGVPIDPATDLPVQIYLWAESAERGFVEKTAAAIMVIIFFLLLMNLLAIYLRQKTRQHNL